MLSASIIDTILKHCANGAGVAIIATDTTTAMRQVTEALPSEAITRASRVNGNEYIDLYNGAHITFHWGIPSLRQRVATLIVIPIGTSGDALEDAIPSIATTNGEIIGYM